MLKSVWITHFLKINSGQPFHREGPTDEIPFCSMFALQKGILSLANIFLVSILQWVANSKFVSDNKEKQKAKQYYIKNLWKIEFDAKAGWWVCQDLSIHMTVSVEIIDMWSLTEGLLFRLIC